MHSFPEWHQKPRTCTALEKAAAGGLTLTSGSGGAHSAEGPGARSRPGAGAAR